MAMIPDTVGSAHDAEAAQATVLAGAAAALRNHTDDRWVEVSGDILTRVMRTWRASHPVSAHGPGGTFHVSENVLRAALQRALDPVPHCEVVDIHVRANGADYTGVTIVVTAKYPHPLIPMADTLRDLAQTCLVEILGPVVPPVTVSAMHVHIGDVTPHDPKLG